MGLIFGLTARGRLNRSRHVTLDCFACLRGAARTAVCARQRCVPLPPQTQHLESGNHSARRIMAPHRLAIRLLMRGPRRIRPLSWRKLAEHASEGLNLSCFRLVMSASVHVHRVRAAWFRRPRGLFSVLRSRFPTRIGVEDLVSLSQRL